MSAPRARMFVKAACPGVSKKVIVFAVVLDLVSPDVLRDSTSFTRSNVVSAVSGQATLSSRGQRDP